MEAGDDDRTGPLRLAFAVHVEVRGEDAAEEATGEESETPAAPPAPESGPEEGRDLPAGEEPSEAPEGRLVVVGDSDFIGNNLALAPLGNADLFLNMVNWLTEDEDLIAIRPRPPRTAESP